MMRLQHNGAYKIKYKVLYTSNSCNIIISSISLCEYRTLEFLIQDTYICLLWFPWAQQVNVGVYCGIQGYLHWPVVVPEDTTGECRCILQPLGIPTLACCGP